MRMQKRHITEHHSTLTRKGQVTIPAEVRRLLGVGPHDRVAFVVEDDHVRLSRSDSIVSRTAGTVPGQSPAPSAEQLRALAEEAMAQEAADRGV